MAVDTETKRRSALGVVIMALAIAPVPDGTVAAVDREHIIGIYAGITPASPGVSTSNIHIFSTGTVEPNHVSDSGSNVLVKGDIEVQGKAYLEQLEVIAGLDIDINASDLIGTGNILPEDDGGQSLGSTTKAFFNLYISNNILLDDGALINAGGSGGPTLTFDFTNNVFGFTFGDVGIRTVTPDETLQVVGSAKFGDDNTNYAKFAADGELTLTGTARVIRHMHFTMELGKGQSAPTERYDEDPFVSYTYAINDDSHITREAPTDMDYTVDSVVKIHWYTTDPTANGDGDEVRWEVQWASRAPGEDITTGDTFGNTGNIVCPVQYIIAETAVVTIPANSIVEGDLIGLHLQRMSIAGGTNPTVGTIHVVHIEFEYTANKLGGAT